MAPATLAAETGTTSLQPSIGEIISRASGATADQLATNKVSVSNVRFDRTDIKESRGLDITYSYDWTAKNLKQGDMLVSDMPDAFTSITKEVGTPFYSNNQELGKLVLDYNNKKIYTYFTGDIDPNKIYNGTINIATFVNRDHFKEVENHEDVQLNLPDGKTATLPLNVTFDAAVYNPELQLVSVYAKESTDNPDGSMNVVWTTTINKVKALLNDAVVYLSPNTVSGINPEFTRTGYDRDGHLIGDPSSQYRALNPEFEDNAVYKIDKESIELYEANIYDSMGYQVGKKLVEGTDYEIVEPLSSPNAYVIQFKGEYASTDKQFVITYGGKVAEGSKANPTINSAVSDSLLAYYRGPKKKYDKEMYEAPFNAVWSEAAINVNNSSVTASMQDTTGSVTVVHVDASTGKVLKAEDYAKTKDGQEAHDVKQGTEYTTAPEKFEGYKFTTLSYDSAPAQGTVKQQLQRVVYLYVPEDKKGSVDVVHKTTDGQILEAVKPVATDENVGTSYSTEKGTFEGYHFVGMAEESAAADGVVTEGTKHVIYLYEKDVVPEVKKGNVDVTYIAEDGTVLEAKSDVVKDGEIGSNYETTQKEFDGYHFTRMGQFSAEATGQVEEGTKHVVYVYAKDSEEKKGSVDVKYITTTGEVLEDVTSVKDNAPVGEDYTTEEKAFDGYHFVGMDKTSDAATGVVAEGAKHVIYVYEKDVTPEVKKGNVDVTYVTEDGRVLEATSDVVKDGEIGSNYETTQKEFAGYHFTRMGQFSAEATGQVEEGTKHVVYVYAKDPEVKKGSVDVKYITTTGEVLEHVTSVKDNAPVGEDYTTEEKSFDGYHFVGMSKDSDAATGVVAEGTKHVIYVYEKDVTPEVKKGNVDVTYVTEDGRVLEATSEVVKDGEIGSNYETTQKEFAGYHFTRMGQFSAEATGQVEEGTKHVVYVYAKDPEVKKGNVDVTYVTEDGRVLEPTSEVVKDGEIGSNYETTQKEFDGYHFTRMGQFSAEATGQVEEGTKHVVYVYAKNPETPVEKKGSVDVKYITKDGKVLEDVTSVKDNAPVGEDYTTEEKSFDGYHFVGMSKDSDAATGVVAEGTKHVIYVYEKDVTPEAKKGSVDVKYITKDGEVLEDVTSVKDNAPVGEDYTTKEKAFDGYHFVGMDKSSDAATGLVAEGTKHVIYVYEKDVTPEVKKGNVDVTYVTEDGTVLEPTSDVVKDGEIGSNYETTQKAFAGYHFTRMGQFSADATGQVEEGTKHVVYVYAKDPEVKKGNVDVTYITEDGRVLEPTSEVVKDGEIGSNYETTQKEFDGYHFTRMGQFSAEATGQVAEGTKHVVYVYAKNPETPVEKKGSVDVKYITTTGEVLEDVTSVKDNAPVGEDYTTKEKAFEGYHFVGMDKSSDAATGVVAEGTKHVIYVYEKDVTPEVKKGSVDVKYITKDGEVLEDVTSVKDNAPVGEDYTTEEKAFDGYHFVGMSKDSDPATGVVSEGSKHVVYVYEKVKTTVVEKGSVDVVYVTSDGKVLEKTSTVKENVPVGEIYETTEKTFDGYHFVGMDKTSEPTSGVVTKGTKHVIYVYEKDPEKETPVEKKGTVTVVYVDKDGNPLPGGEKLTIKDNVPVGEDYATEQKKFDGYHFVGMGKNSSPVSGKVTEGTKEVIYVYEKDKTPTPKTPRLPRTGRPQQGTPTQEQVVSQTSVATSTVKRHLPKTGTTNQSSNTVLGLASLSFAGLLGLIIKRRRGENE
ncbi:MucBP domain-containing protein [Enterococcus cecorum]|uniref:MucBP domain-containing protein n=1 Tax=Enterococcus cecorum TaxID=44008 RepID=UPI00148B3A93|nr:MucBP domain-containing protein [Enterococcus cecorum]